MSATEWHPHTTRIHGGSMALSAITTKPSSSNSQPASGSESVWPVPGSSVREGWRRTKLQQVQHRSQRGYCTWRRLATRTSISRLRMFKSLPAVCQRSPFLW